MNQQVNQDLEHLKILSILFYVKAGLTTFAGLIVLFYFVFVGLFISSIGGVQRPGQPSTAAVGGVFIVIGLAVTLFIGLIAFLEFYAGRCLSSHKKHTFCMVIAAFVCLSIPLGTLLGIFTIIVLMRDSVKAMFNGQNFSQFNNSPNWQ